MSAPEEAEARYRIIWAAQNAQSELQALISSLQREVPVAASIRIARSSDEKEDRSSEHADAVGQMRKTESAAAATTASDHSLKLPRIRTRKGKEPSEEWLSQREEEKLQGQVRMEQVHGQVSSCGQANCTNHSDSASFHGRNAGKVTQGITQSSDAANTGSTCEPKGQSSALEPEGAYRQQGPSATLEKPAKQAGNTCRKQEHKKESKVTPAKQAGSQGSTSACQQQAHCAKVTTSSHPSMDRVGWTGVAENGKEAESQQWAEGAWIKVERILRPKIACCNKCHREL